MKRMFKIIFAIAFSLAIVFSFAACGASDDTSRDSGKDTTLEEDAKKAEIKAEDGVIKVDIPTKHFIGTWTADSGQAEHLYGNLEITLNDDNTWTGNVTGEKLYGTWEERDFGVHLYDEVELWECDLFYTDKGNFVLNEDEFKVVLTKH